MRNANYDKSPFVQVEVENVSCVTGWQSIGEQLNQQISQLNKRVVVIECYQGVYDDEIVSNLKSSLKHDAWLNARDAFKDEQEILNLTYPDVTDDRIFGYLTRLNISDYLDQHKTAQLQKKSKCR